MLEQFAEMVSRDVASAGVTPPRPRGGPELDDIADDGSVVEQPPGVTCDKDDAVHLLAELETEGAVCLAEAADVADEPVRAWVHDSVANRYRCDHDAVVEELEHAVDGGCDAHSVDQATATEH